MTAYNKTLMKKAILQSNGTVYSVSQSLHCDWSTARKYIRKHNLMELLQSRKGILYGKGVNVIETELDRGNPDVAKWVVARLGKEDGFSERQEITGKDGNDITTTHGLTADAMNTIKTILETKASE